MIVPHSKSFKSLGSTIIEMGIDGKACCMEDIKNLPDISNCSVVCISNWMYKI